MSRYLEMVRGQNQYRPGPRFTAKSLLLALAMLLTLGSGVFWWNIQRELTGSWPIALTFTLIMVAAPPILTSFLIPWSPGGMLLQRINARTVGYAVVIGISLFLLYYSFHIQMTWWNQQPNTSGTNMVFMQAIIGIIGFILVPALSWTPVSGDELVEQIKQAHLVRRYELQTQADIAILRATLLRAQQKALVGFANLTVSERKELAAVMHGLIEGIDTTLKRIGQSVDAVSSTVVPFESLEDNKEIRGYLGYVSETLSGSTLVVAPEYQLEDNHDDERMPPLVGRVEQPVAVSNAAPVVAPAVIIGTPPAVSPAAHTTTVPSVPSNEQRWRLQQENRTVLEGGPLPFVSRAATQLWWYDPIAGQSVILGTIKGDFLAQAQFRLRGQEIDALEVPYRINADYGLTSVPASLVARMRLAGYTDVIGAYVFLSPEIALA